jgi:lipoprotein-anchoring transpeptidase ErfK/SrfK
MNMKKAVIALAILFGIATGQESFAHVVKRPLGRAWTVNPKNTDRLIRVSIPKQRLYFFENGRLIHTFICSTSSGKIYPDNIHPKRPHDHIGIFKIDYKEIDHYSKLFKVHMPYALHVWSGHFIHETKLTSQLGQPASHGCIRLNHSNAKWLYRHVQIGDMVEIR